MTGRLEDQVVKDCLRDLDSALRSYRRCRADADFSRMLIYLTLVGDIVDDLRVRCKELDRVDVLENQLEIE